MMRTWESSSSSMTKKPWLLAPLPAPRGGNTAAIALKGLGKGKGLGERQGPCKKRGQLALEDGNADDPPPPQEDPEKEA